MRHEYEGGARGQLGRKFDRPTRPEALRSCLCLVAADPTQEKALTGRKQPDGEPSAASTLWYSALLAPGSHILSPPLAVTTSSRRCSRLSPVFRRGYEPLPSRLGRPRANTASTSLGTLLSAVALCIFTYIERFQSVGSIPRKLPSGKSPTGHATNQVSIAPHPPPNPGGAARRLILSAEVQANHCRRQIRVKGDDREPLSQCPRDGIPPLLCEAKPKSRPWSSANSVEGSEARPHWRRSFHIAL